LHQFISISAEQERFDAWPCARTDPSRPQPWRRFFRIHSFNRDCNLSSMHNWSHRRSFLMPRDLVSLGRGTLKFSRFLFCCRETFFAAPLRPRCSYFASIQCHSMKLIIHRAVLTLEHASRVRIDALAFFGSPRQNISGPKRTSHFFDTTL
jgi:hypothetical protein